jgi:hypothetical protein
MSRKDSETWGTPSSGSARDPSLRLKSGSAQDDALEGNRDDGRDATMTPSKG